MKQLRHVTWLLLLAVVAALGCGQSLVEFPLDTPPEVISTVPENGATGVPPTGAIRAVFRTAMNAETITAETFFLTQGTSKVSATVTYKGGIAVLAPTAALDEGSLFVATVSAGVTDLDGTAMVEDYIWSFTTGAAPVLDTTPPTVLITSPVDTAVGVVTGTKVLVAFSEPLDPDTIGASTFTLSQGGTPIAASVSYTDTAAILTPDSPFEPGVTLTATVTTGVTDLAGNALEADYVWSFTTNPAPDTTPPAVLSTDPDTGATGVAIDSPIRAVFTEVIDISTLTPATFTVTQGGMPVLGFVGYTGVTATFAPTENLLPGIPCTATITTDVKDLAGNALAADYTWTFATGTPPEVLFTNPANGAFGVAVDRQVDVVFTVPMDPTTIDDVSFTVRHGAVPVPGTVTAVGATATFVPADDYPLNAILTATITTAVTDTLGNALLNDYVWTFQTGAKMGQDQIDLGSAATFAILAFNTVTNVNNPGTIITGDLGVSPGAAVVGFPPGQVVGATHAGDAVAAMAKVDLLTAYNEAAGRLGAAVLPGDLSGLTFYPGLYKNSTSVLLSAGNFTLDAQGDVNAVFIFQMGSTFTSSAGTQMILSGGAKAGNIYWSVGTSATLGTNSISKGNFLAGSAVTANTGATIEGRLLALGAAVNLDTTTVTIPSP